VHHEPPDEATGGAEALLGGLEGAWREPRSRLRPDPETTPPSVDAGTAVWAEAALPAFEPPEPWSAAASPPKTTVPRSASAATARVTRRTRRT
jgi:hypothetical protein